MKLFIVFSGCVFNLLLLDVSHTRVVLTLLLFPQTNSLSSAETRLTFTCVVLFIGNLCEVSRQPGSHFGLRRGAVDGWK